LETLFRSIRENPWLTAVLLLALLLNLVAIDWGLPHVHSWTADDISPRMPLAVIEMSRSSHHKYPFGTWWINLFLYSPWLFYWWMTGDFEIPCYRGDSSCFSDPYQQLGLLMLLTRFMHVAMGVGIVFLAYKICLRLFRDRVGATFAALFTACSCVLVYRSHVGNTDLPATFWMTCALYAYIRIMDHNRLRDFVAFSLTTAMALGIKEQIVGVYVLIVPAIYFRFMTWDSTERSFDGAAGFARKHLDWRLPILFLLPLLVYALIQNVFFNWEGFVAHVTLWIGESGSIRTNEMPKYQGPMFLMELFHSRWSRSSGPLLTNLCLAGAALSLIIRPRRATLIVLPLLSYYVCSLQIAAHMVYPRLILPTVPMLGVCGGWLVGWLLQRGHLIRWAGYGIGAYAAAYGLLICINLDIAMIRDARYHAENWLSENVASDRTFGVFSLVYYLPRLDYLGYEYETYSEQFMTPTAFEAEGPDYLVLTSRYFDRFKTGEQKEFYDALLAGELQYRVAWHEWELPPLKKWIKKAYIPTSVNAKIYVLERKGIEDPNSSHSGS
jgi:hypothetical protein